MTQQKLPRGYSRLAYTLAALTLILLACVALRHKTHADGLSLLVLISAIATLVSIHTHQIPRENERAEAEEKLRQAQKHEL